MRIQIKIAALSLLLASSAFSVQAQGTAFTYQGRLTDANGPFSGSVDLRFALFDAPTSGGQQGSLLTNSPTAVSNGLFTVALDFGNQFPGAERWLELAVRTNGGGVFTTLEPRQALTATPYAVTASNLVGTVSAAQVNGTLAFAQLPPTVLTNGGSISGSFSGNGAGVTNVNAASLGGISSTGFWKTNGNTGANPTNGAFLGTADNLPLDFKVNASRALRLEFATNGFGDDSPNVIGGFSANVVSNGFVGGFIGGGGSVGHQNRVGNDFASVVGGAGNIAAGNYSTAMGFGARALGYTSLAAGDGVFATGDSSIAMGQSSTSSGFGAVAIGSGALADGDLAVAIGSAHSSSNYSLAIGVNSTASGEVATSIGEATTASGSHAFALGAGSFASGDYSMALGYFAITTNRGSFVWTDTSGINNFASTSSNQFLIRAAKGMGINTNNPQTALHVHGAVTATNFIGSGAGLTSLNASNFVNGTVPDARLSANVSLLGASIESAEITDGTIANADIANAAITDAKLATISTAGKVANSATTATNANVPNTIVLRDASGNFSANIISGNGSGLTNITAFTNSDFVAQRLLIGNGHQLAAFLGGIAGGQNNTNSGNFSVVSGGQKNTVQPLSAQATIAGGALNVIQLNSSFGSIGGGVNQLIASNSEYATIAGGNGNKIGTNSDYSTIGGGRFNGISGQALYSTMSGGEANGIQTNNYSFIGGGSHNSIEANSSFSVLVGGELNQILADSDHGVIAGGGGNIIRTNSQYAVIGGGALNTIAAFTSAATIAGGSGHAIGTNSSQSTISGGTGNIIAANALSSTIGGGDGNTINTNSFQGVIAGGNANTIGVFSPYSTISGGRINVVGAGVTDATIAGGLNNSIATNAARGTISGGSDNRLLAGAQYSLIAGGYLNDIGVNSTYSSIGGGTNNAILANASFATIPGGDNNSATNSAFAAGRRATAIHSGSFVWGDASTTVNVSSTAANSVTMRAAGGYRLYSSSATNSGVSLAPGGTAWAIISDRNVKKDFAAIDTVEILEKLTALPITQWHYNWETTETTPHIGPMAQDFKAAFYPGSDDKSITTLEADGVAFAAIQGLNQKLERKDAEIAELKARLEKVEKLLERTLK